MNGSLTPVGALSKFFKAEDTKENNKLKSTKKKNQHWSSFCDVLYNYKDNFNIFVICVNWFILIE